MLPSSCLHLRPQVRRRLRDERRERRRAGREQRERLRCAARPRRRARPSSRLRSSRGSRSGRGRPRAAPAAGRPRGARRRRRATCTSRVCLSWIASESDGHRRVRGRRLGQRQRHDVARREPRGRPDQLGAVAARAVDEDDRRPLLLARAARAGMPRPSCRCSERDVVHRDRVRALVDAALVDERERRGGVVGEVELRNALRTGSTSTPRSTSSPRSSTRPTSRSRRAARRRGRGDERATLTPDTMPPVRRSSAVLRGSRGEPCGYPGGPCPSRTSAAATTCATSPSSPTSTTGRRRSSTRCSGSRGRSARTRTSTSASWTRPTSSARRGSRSSPRTRPCSTAT